MNVNELCPRHRDDDEKRDKGKGGIDNRVCGRLFSLSIIRDEQACILAHLVLKSLFNIIIMMIFKRDLRWRRLSNVLYGYLDLIEYNIISNDIQAAQMSRYSFRMNRDGAEKAVFEMGSTGTAVGHTLYVRLPG